jgi:ferric-dicitrate binding protein FerR (iron transport regulator)
VTELRCADVEARFVDAFDGRLDPAESVRFHSHIEGCAACRERAALWRALTPRLRDAVPPGPDAMATRRMQVEIERGLASHVAVSPARRWRPWWAPAFGLVAAAAAVVIWLRVGKPAPAPAVGYAAFVSVQGDARIGERASQAAARVPVGAPIALSAGAVVELALDSGAALRIEGPGSVALDGSARDVAVRLSAGKLQARVAHRQPNETFAVLTKDVRVVVRGTTFGVAAGAAGSRVEVSEGQVAVTLGSGETRLVSAGDSFDSTAAAVAPADGETQDVAAPAEAASGCAQIARSCQATARAIRTSMRAGESDRALRMISDARRAAHASDASCPGGAGACDDELRYLHAEALNQAGRLDDAVAAYRALDRRGAPSAMRQNALYAAAQIERRQGRTAAAAADFERALAAAPRGALHEDALVGAMDSARAAGDTARARALAARYLEEFPRGLAAPAARKLAHDSQP